MPAIPIAELRRHLPMTDCHGHFVACACGWKLQEGTDDLWQTWLEHLIPAGPPNFQLTEYDKVFLAGAHIKP